jgi:hypothetical protein
MQGLYASRKNLLGTFGGLLLSPEQLVHSVG